MLVTHKLCLDLVKQGCQPVVAAVQGEANTRQLAISLFSNSVAWEIPEGATAAVAFLKPDGTKGLYDKLPDGTVATTLSGNTVTAILAPQALTCAGTVLTSIVFYDADGDTLATFPFKITVEKNPAAGEQISNDYYNPSIFDMDAAVKALELRVEDLEKGNTGGGSGGGIAAETDPTVPAWAKQPNKPTYTASEVGARPATWMPTAQEVGALPSTYTPPNQTAEQVGADPKGTAANAVSEHNTADSAHGDIRLLITGLANRLNALANSTDTDLDQMAELVAYIKNNKSLIDGITTSKVSVSDIVNNLSTNASTKPLSAAQGVTLKALIDAITVPTKLSQLTNDKGYLTEHQDISGKLDASALPTAINTALAQAKASGEFDGEDGYTPVKGKDYFDGKDGKTPVKGVDYFDGTDGNDGYTPVRGVDYWTSADKAEIEAHIATELAKRGQLEPLYADSIEKCTDTTKLYVLPDGMIYAWMLTEKEVEGGGGDYTNILPLAVNADGTPYVGNNGEDGYKTGYRLNSSKAEVTQDGMCCTGFMPITTNGAWYGTLRMKNITVDGTKGGYIYAYDSGRTTGRGSSSVFATTLKNNYDANTGVYTLVIGNPNNADGVELDDSGFMELDRASYLRISIGNINENTIITWNEEITEASTEIIKEYAWASTGLAFVPADYEDRIIELEEQTAQNTADIATLKNGAVDTGGVDALTWIRNWDSPIYDRVPVFQLSSENPAVTTSDTKVASIYSKYDALVAAHPNYITKKDLGVCSDGVTHVYRYDFCEPEPHHQSGMQWSETKPVVICASGIHWEWGGVYSLYYALKAITENAELDDLRRNVHFVVVPIINPYCFTDIGPYSETYGVLNANGVQIHRNFEVGFKYPGTSGHVALGDRNHGGTEPLSEIETKNIDNIFKEFPDAALFLTCHSAQRDTRWGTGFIWASTATNYTCNLGYRLVDKMSKAWHTKYGTTWEEGCVRENEYVLANPSTYPNGVQLADGDYRAGHAHVSSTDGTETRQATKYGIQGANVEVLDTFWVLSSTGLDSKLTTHGAEVYINYLLMYMGCYDHKDKKQYYIQ